MNRKLKSRLLNNKAYLQLDLAFALLIYFTFFIFVSSLFYSEYGNQEKSLEIDRLKLEAQDICELLVSSPGQPRDWDKNISLINILGLKDANRINLSLNKVSFLNNSNYGIISNTFNNAEYIYYINIINLENNLLIGEFGYEPSLSSKEGAYTCYGNLGRNIVKINVEVWK